MSITFKLNTHNTFSLIHDTVHLKDYLFSIQLAGESLTSQQGELISQEDNTYTFRWDNGLMATYSVSLESDTHGAYLDMTLTNTSKETMVIDSISPLYITGHNLVLGEGIEDWMLYKNGLRKNDTVCVHDFCNPRYPLKELVGSGGELGQLSYNPILAEVEATSHYLTMLKSVSTGCSLLLGSMNPEQEFSTHTFRCSADQHHFRSLQITTLYEGKTLQPNESLTVGQLLISFHEDDYKAIESYANLTGRKQHTDYSKLPQLGWCSWYFFYENITQEKVLANAKIIHQQELPLEYMLIDMGWEERLGTWHANHDFPKGMKWLADQIKSYGMKAGLWLSPFWVEPRSEIHRDHPDWLLRDQEGNLITFKCHIPGFVIDTSIPEARQWITDVFHRVTQEWGYELVKVDFLRAIAIYKDAQFRNPMTRAEALRLGMEAIRAGIGDDTAMIACGGQYGPTLGLADINRTSSDISARWSSVRNTFKKNLLRFWMNKRWWANDPDCIVIRDETEGISGHTAGSRGNPSGSFNETEVDTILDLFVALNGTFQLGDDLTRLNHKKISKIKKALVGYDKTHMGAVPRDLFQNPYPHILHKALDTHTHEVTLVNWEEDEAGLTKGYTLRELIGNQSEDCTYKVEDLKASKDLGEYSISDTLPSIHLPYHGSVKLMITSV